MRLIIALIFTFFVAPAFASHIITFDPPGSTSTDPGGITASGVIIGSYTDASGVTHGFLRTPGGAFTTFDVPGSTYTTATSITPGGVITGYYGTAIGGTNGFVRALDGSITTFDAPLGFGILGSIYNGGSQPPSINPAGTIAGTYSGFPSGNFEEHGFVRTPDGTFTTFDIPVGSTYTEALAINPAGMITGDYCDDVQCSAFLRAPDGTVTSFDPPGCSDSIGFAINPAGAVMGATFASVSLGSDPVPGFLRNPDGTFELFTGPSASTNYTAPIAMNAAGAITGYSCDAAGCHGLLRAPDGTLTSFDPPGSTFTVGTAINPSGVITGFFYAVSGQHGFVLTP